MLQQPLKRKKQFPITHTMAQANKTAYLEVIHLLSVLYGIHFYIKPNHEVRLL